MASRQQLEDALIAAHEAGDPEAAQLFAQEIKSLAPKRPHDPMNDPPLLPGEEGYDATPSPAPSPLRGLRRYRDRLSEASERVGRSMQPGPFGLDIGSLEAAGTMATGGLFAPILGTAESIALGTQPEESFARYTYQPRTESGKAQLGYLGALMSPITSSGADIALMPLAQGSQALRQPRGAPPRVPNERPAPVPTTQKLTQAADQAYAASESAGVVIRPESTARAAGMFREVAQAENLGKLPPKLSEAVTVLDDRIASAQPLTLKDADKVRQLIGDAMKSNDAADRRLAKIIQGRYDRYIETLAPQDILSGNTEQGVAMLNQARDLFRRRRNSEMLDAMERRAQRKGESTYTQAGTEHALRREFEKLADNEKRMRTLTPEQRAAVEKVAAPGLGQTMLRNLGKFDPTAGGMSSLVSLGTGTLATGVTGNPLGMTLPVAGFIAKRAATGMTNRNVGKAREALVGRGLPLLPAQADTIAQPATPVRGLLAAGEPPEQKGLLGAGASRSLEQIQQDLRKLDAKMQKLPPDEPLDSQRMKALAGEWERLRAELSAAESGGVSR